MAQERLQKNPEDMSEGRVRRFKVIRQQSQHSTERKYKAKPSLLGEGQGAQAMQGKYGSLKGVFRVQVSYPRAKS